MKSLDLHCVIKLVFRCAVIMIRLFVVSSAMGATISSHTHGASVSEYGKGKLEFTPQNEALLNEIVKLVEGLVSSHPREAETILKEPFKWHSTLNPDSFGELNFGSMGFQIT